MAKIVMPTTDLGFKKILASNEHKTITQGFIADFFGLHVKLDDIHIVNPYSIKTYPDPTQDDPAQILRHTSRDVTVEVDLVDMTVELQMRHQPTFVQRAYYYLADLYTSGYNRDLDTASLDPDRYSSLRPAWSINILGEAMFDCPHSYHMFTLHDHATGEELAPELVRFGFYELTKTDAQPQMARWRDFLTTGQASASDPDYLREAASIIEYINLSPQERHMIDAMEKASADYDAGLYWARHDGIQETRLSTGRAALRLGIPHDQVAEITSLDADTVSQLAEELASAPTSS